MSIIYSQCSSQRALKKCKRDHFTSLLKTLSQRHFSFSVKAKVNTRVSKVLCDLTPTFHQDLLLFIQLLQLFTPVTLHAVSQTFLFFFFSYLRALVLGLTSVWNILPPDILFDKFLMFPNILCFLILLTSEVFPRLCYLIMKSASIPHFWHFSHCYAFLYMLYVYIHNFLYNFIYYTFFCLLVFIFKDVIPF